MKIFIKIIIAFVITIITENFGIAQDVITLKNGADINALVQEIGDVEIKYKKFDNPSGPNYTLKKSEILIIRYANGSKDIFSEEAKSIEQKDISISESTSVINNENVETVHLPEYMQSRKDVIVKSGYAGFQAKITAINNGHIYYIKNGKEKEKKIKQKRVLFTLTFNEKAKQEKYPIQMNSQDFTSIPTYLVGNNWVVFGTNSMDNLSLLAKTYPNIYDDYTTGKRKLGNASGLYLGSSILYLVGLIPGLIMNVVANTTAQKGIEKINNAFKTYYSICVDFKVLDKYGIIITPYRGISNENQIFDNLPYTTFSELGLQMTPPLGSCTWYEAKRICKELSQGGFSDWYLPSKLELEQILKQDPNLKKQLTNPWHWTSSEIDDKNAYNIRSNWRIDGVEEKDNNRPDCMCVRKIK